MKQSVKLIVGNWKMNGLAAQIAEAEALAAALISEPTVNRVAICPPFTLIAPMVARLEGNTVAVGGQDCHAEASGAFTGSVSAGMLGDAGATLVILGHSERRQMSGETDAVVAAKVEAALSGRLEPIICVGETLAEREAGAAIAVVTDQLEGALPDALRGRAFAVAYEPVWAIGTGLTPTLEQIAEVHNAVRAALEHRFGEQAHDTPILYGGSVNPKNAAEILSTMDVDGALVGGASLKAEDFMAIVRAA